jgi:hypothetical protein
MHPSGNERRLPFRIHEGKMSSPTHILAGVHGPVSATTKLAKAAASSHFLSYALRVFSDTPAPRLSGKSDRQVDAA